MAWNLNEFRELCSKKGISESTIYQNSLQWRWLRADYHAEQAQKTWTDLFQQDFTFGDQRSTDAIFIYEAHAEACVQALHSMADTLAQIINIAVLGSHFPEDQVSFKGVTNIMTSRATASNVSSRAQSLLDSGAFRYVDAFCNTIKHRRLISTAFQAEYGVDARNEAGLLFAQFNYKGVSYPETWGSDILGTYRPQIFDLVTDVGLGISDFLR